MQPDVATGGDAGEALTLSSLHSPAAARPPAPAWIDLDGGHFISALGRAPVTFRHHLGGHPLLARPAVVHLAGEVPASWALAHAAAGLPVLMPSRKLPVADQPTAELAREVETNGFRVTIYSLERLAAFQSLLDECLEPVAAVVGDREGGLRRRGINVWLACPGAVVPVHCDRHHNLLLQLDGTKEVGIGFFASPEVQQREAEGNHSRPARNPARAPDGATTVFLGPGDGVYIPPYAFHWVKGGGDVSVAASLGFTTPRSARTELVHECNALMRRLRLTPTAPGVSSWRDRSKETSVHAWREGRRRAVASRRVLKRRLHRG